MDPQSACEAGRIDGRERARRKKMDIWEGGSSPEEEQRRWEGPAIKVVEEGPAVVERGR
jgi:hypothetical protein